VRGVARTFGLSNSRLDLAEPLHLDDRSRTGSRALGRGQSGVTDVWTITLSNNKGGSAKTTTAVSLAAAFAETGRRVLVVDLDPQASATHWLGGRESPVGLAELAGGGVRVAQLLQESSAPGVDLIPSGPSLVPSGRSSPNDVGLSLVRGFARLPDYWDIVLVDTPPTVGHLSLVPLVGSDHVLIPVEAHALAIPGVASVIESIGRARERVNPRLELLGIVVCRVDATNHARDVLARLRATFGHHVLDRTVREATYLAEAPVRRLPITRFAPTSAAAEDYRAIALECLGRVPDSDSIV
jgi:chromosome partitioning protein